MHEKGSIVPLSFSEIISNPLTNYKNKLNFTSCGVAELSHSWLITLDSFITSHSSFFHICPLKAKKKND